ncbi:MAG: hypothetical protein RTU09_04180 [Candidatus Thorarchaeota archaeon]
MPMLHRASDSALKWVVPGAVGAAWSFRMALDQSTQVMLESIVGMALLIVALTIYARGREKRYLLWNSSTGVVASVTPFAVEVCAARLMTSVPLGIDLSHSAKRVLEAMTIRFNEDKGTELRFFVCRPLGRGVTRVGMLVVRQALKTRRVKTVVENLSEKVVEDVMTLESALRAAYPHMPVTRAELDDITLANSGGVNFIVS